MIPHLHLFASLLILLLPIGVRGGSNIDSLLTALLQGSNRHPAVDVAVESFAQLTPVIEVGWTVHQGWLGRAGGDCYADDNYRLGASALLTTQLLSLAVKYTLRRQRPVRGYRPRLWNTRITPSFPSGHTASSAAFATILAWRVPGRAPFARLYVLASGWSQIYVGNHFVGDVLAGAALGWAVARWMLNGERDRACPAEAAGSLALPPLRISIAF